MFTDCGNLWPNLLSGTIGIGVMDDVQRYRAKAEECRKAAAKALSPTGKAAWLQLAADWLQLAEQRSAGSQRFDDMTRERGTGQPDSESSH